MKIFKLFIFISTIFFYSNGRCNILSKLDSLLDVQTNLFSDKIEDEGVEEYFSIQFYAHEKFSFIVWYEQKKIKVKRIVVSGSRYRRIKRKDKKELDVLIDHFSYFSGSFLTCLDELEVSDNRISHEFNVKYAYKSDKSKLEQFTYGITHISLSKDCFISVVLKKLMLMI